jgi:hypothetical protein
LKDKGLNRDQLQSRDLLNMTVIPCGDPIAAFERTGTDQQVIEGAADASPEASVLGAIRKRAINSLLI